LDGVRGIAIALVLLGHGLWETPYRSTALGLGYAGVSVFLVLSGYLITRVLLSEEFSIGHVRLLRFYGRRALRIFPVFYVYLAVLAVLSFGGIVPPPDRATWLASLFYFRNIDGAGWETAHLWTLSLEEQFYVFWPSIFVLTPRRFRISAIMILVVGFTASRAYTLFSGHYDGGLYVRPELRMDTFLIGAAFAISDWTFVRRRSAHFVLAALVLWTIMTPRFLGTATEPGLIALLDTPVSAFLLGGLISWLAKSSGEGAARFLSSRPIVALGVVSYSIYLWQQLFLGPGMHWWSLPALVVAALLSYRLIEKPTMQLKATVMIAPGSAYPYSVDPPPSLT
jgi:peptidoglycan/LPS O-acetylase OafA/YrhL